MNTYATRVNAAFTTLYEVEAGHMIVSREALEEAQRIVNAHKGPTVVALEARIAELEATRGTVDVQARKASRTARINRRARLEALELESLEDAS